MKASLPRRMTLHAIEAAFLTLGYQVKRETFDLVAFKTLRKGRRFHTRLETHGLETVPRGAELDLHIDFLRENAHRSFHGSQAESEAIAFEVAQVLGALSDQDPNRARPRVRCPECGKEFGQDVYQAHRAVVHRHPGNTRL